MALGLLLVRYLKVNVNNNVFSYFQLQPHIVTMVNTISEVSNYEASMCSRNTLYCSFFLLLHLYDVSDNRYTTVAIVRTEAPPTSCT